MSRLSRVAVLALYLAASACGRGPSNAVVAIAHPDTVLPPRGRASAFVLDTLARDLVVPWGVAVAPDGRIFITERRGRILLLSPGSDAVTEWARLEVHAEDPSWGPESGLMGVALAPDFASTGQVFVMATVRRAGNAGTTPASRIGRWRHHVVGLLDPTSALEFETRIVRLTEREGRGTEPTVIVAGVPANHYHAGGGLAFGPDSMLYAGFGDAQVVSFPRDSTVLAGKIARMDRQGRAPHDNPIPGSLVHSTGLRNPQAFTWLGDGTMIMVEHGPSGMPHERGRAGRDELNLATPGADFGWPDATGWESAPGLTPPLWVWRDAIAPAGIAVDRVADHHQSSTVLVGSLKGGVERLDLERGPDGWRVASRERLLDGSLGRIRTIVSSPDGTFLITTSNRDARGTPRPGDDLLLRMRLLP